MAFVNSISFSHRFSDEEAMSNYCSYQEVNHTYSGDNATAIARAYVQFMLACGYSPSSVLQGMEAITSEYSQAWGYTVKNKDD
jgi:thiaminase